MAVTKGTGAASAQLYVADTEGERDTGWPEGSNVFCKDTNKLYYLKAGAWVLLGGGSIITDLYGSLTAKYFLASPTAIAGVPSFRVIDAADIPTLNQSTTGSAAKWTTARSLAGNSVDGTADVAFANKFIVQGTADAGLSQAQFLGALTTGIVKNTTTTGILSIATAGTDYSVPSGIEAFTGAKTFGAAGAVGKLIIAGNTSGTTILNAAATAGASTLTLQAIDGTIYSTGGTDVSLADGGTGASLSDPAAHTLMGWDNTDNAICFITIGANLTYTQATHTLSASATSGATTALDNLASVAINTSLVSDTDSTDDLGSATIHWANVYTDRLISSLSNLVIENDLSDGDISFKVNDGGVDTTVMTIDGATGNVGIGTTSPGAKLHIYSGGTDYAEFKIESLARTPSVHFKQGANDWYWKVDHSDSKFKITKDSSDFVTIDTLGNVGIGTTNPQTKLTLALNSAISFEASAGVTDIAITHTADTLTFTGGTIVLGTATATGGLTGNVTGNASGSSGSCTGNSATVTTNANLTGIVTSVGNATAIADKAISYTKLADGTDGNLITWDAAGVAALVATGDAGQVLTSNGAGAAPTFQAAAAGGGLTWNEVTGTAQDAAVDNGYICNNAALVTVTLPTTAAVGKVVRIAGKGAGLWKVAQNADEYIKFGLNSTTTGTGGSLAATQQYDTVELLCTVADTGWTVISSIGNITVV